VLDPGLFYFYFLGEEMLVSKTGKFSAHVEGILLRASYTMGSREAMNVMDTKLG